MRLMVLVGRVVERHGGTVNAAAPKVEISQPTLNRLSKGTGNFSQKTMASLEKALLEIDPGLAAELPLCVVSPAALRLYRTGYQTWCEERAQRLARRRGQAWKLGSKGVPKRVRSRYGRVGLDYDLARVGKLARAGHPKLFQNFRTLAAVKGIPQERFDAAVVRVLEPLAEAAASAYFEPRWQDLSPEQQRAFLRHGFAREELLLAGPHPLAVAADLAAGRQPRPKRPK